MQCNSGVIKTYCYKKDIIIISSDDSDLNTIIFHLLFQVKSLLDIPNFIFNKSLSPVASAIYPAPNTEVMATLDATKNKLINTSQDSGISNCTTSDDFLNCSTASFVVGGGPMTGKSSDSELSDAYTPPRTPEMKKKMLTEVVKKQPSAVEE